jgi:uncharacterized integral membrane protein
MYYHARFQASAEKYIRNALFWVVTQGAVVISYRLFGTSCRSLLQESRFKYFIHLLTTIGLTPGGSSTVHIYTQTVHRTTQQFWKCGPCPVLASYTLAFAFQPRKKNGRTSVSTSWIFPQRKG